MLRFITVKVPPSPVSKDDLLPVIRHEDRYPVAKRVAVEEVSVTRLVEVANRAILMRITKKKSLTDRELITLARQHDCRGRLLDDPEVDVKL